MTIPTGFEARVGFARKPEMKRPGSSGMRLPPIVPRTGSTFGKPLKKKEIRTRWGTAEELGIRLIGKKRDFVLCQLLRTPPVSARGRRTLPPMTSLSRGSSRTQSRTSSRPTSARKKENTKGAESKDRENDNNIDPQKNTLDAKLLETKLLPLQSKADNVDDRLGMLPVQPPNASQVPLQDNEDSKNSAENKVKMKKKTKSKLHKDVMSELQFDVFDEDMDEEVLKSEAEANGQKRRVWCGQCQLSALPPLPKKVVRVFISSTFTDTTEERNALMQYVYPRLSEYCRQEHGLEFQVVDMRWGVPEQAADNHTTTDLCIQEIKKCQEVSVGPNFVAIIGDKYGYRPIPSTIEEDLFSAFAQVLVPGSASAVDPGSEVDWDLFTRAYRKDNNAQPPVYVLQRISVLVPDYSSSDPVKQKRAWAEWTEISHKLTHTLRTLAKRAHSAGKISEQQKHIFIMSVTEREITEGLNQSQGDPADSCICIMRSIVDILKHLQDARAPRFVDMQAEGALDDEARQLLEQLKQEAVSKVLPEKNQMKRIVVYETSGARLSLEKFRSVDVEQVASKKQVDPNKLKLYAKYLDHLCEGFFKKLTNLIENGSIQQRKMHDDFTSEVLQHWHLAKLRCEVFEGRTEELNQAKAFLTAAGKEDTQYNGPLVIFGHSGCGKTSVLAKIMENVSSGSWKAGDSSQFNVVTRFLGTTPNTSNLHQLLTHLCTQLALIYDVKNWVQPEKIMDLIESFHDLLGQATAEKPLVLILDSIDQLMPAYNAYKCKWLPRTIPAHVKIAVSTIVEGYPIFDSLQSAFRNKGKFIEITQLGDKLGLEIIYLWLKKDGRTMTTQQEQIIVSALQKCSLPLYARIAYDHIHRWKSYDVPVVSDLETTVRGAINKLFQSMEDKFGAPIVRHSLAFLTASRYGLSEVELEHILSLDDTLLNKVFKFWKPPVRRIPPLLWTRVRTEVHSYIVERSADDTIVLYWYHRQFIEATKARYLADPVFVQEIHEILADFFMGRWGGGVEKPFQYSEVQVKRFNLSSADSAEDRKVPLQPNVFQSNADTDYTELSAEEFAASPDIRPNKRKLTELPFQLVKCGQHQQMMKRTFFNYNWLYAKIIATSPQQLLEEMELFIHSDKILKKNYEMKLLFVNLQLIKPFVTRLPKSLPYELCGRLAKYIGQAPLISQLIKGCSTVGLNQCPVLPLATCFESADLNLSQNINFRSTEPWQDGGAFTFSANFKTVYILDYDDNGLPLIRSFDTTNGDKVNEVYIIKTKPESQKDTIDVYFQLYMLASGKHILALYKQKYVVGMRSVYRNYGLFDVIDITTGMVTKSVDEPLRKNVNKMFNNPVIYMTANWMCIKLGWKMSIYNLHNDQIMTLKKPTYLHPSEERFFVFCGQKKTELNVFDSRHPIAEFDVPGKQLVVTANSDMSYIAMFGSDKVIRLFNMKHKHLHTSEDKPSRGNMLKCSRTLDLPVKVRVAMSEIYAGIVEAVEEGEAGDVIHSRFVLEFSPNKHTLVLILQGGEEWQAFMWHLYRTGYLGALTPRMPIQAKHPQFNHSGSVALYAEEEKLVVVSCETCERVNEFNMASVIKDIQTSKVSDKVAVMLDKSVVLMNITADVEGSEAAKVKGAKNTTFNPVMLQRIHEQDFTHCEVILQRSGDGLALQEVVDPVLTVDTDRVGTARSRKREALYVFPTPNGKRAIHVHSAAQVIDTQDDVIVYTPKKGDKVLREGNSHDIPGLSPLAPSAMDLMPGDHIIAESTKIKFRADGSKYRIMDIPSLITIYSTVTNKLERIKRIVVNGESVLAVNDDVIVTAKMFLVEGDVRRYCKIYDQITGKCIASHKYEADCQSSTFSQNGALLFVVDSGLTIYLYEAPSFGSIERKVDVRINANTFFRVIDAQSFPDSPYSLVIQYLKEGLGTQTATCRYKYVNCLTNEIGKLMKLDMPLEDVSGDGLVALDNTLTLFDLISGEALVQIEHGNSEALQLRARLSRNKRYVVYVDKSEDTLHVVRLSPDMTSYKHIAACYTHAPNLDLQHGLELREQGHVICLRSTDKSLIMHTLQDMEDKSKTDTDSVYESERTWIQAQLKKAVGPNTVSQAPAGKEKQALSMYKLRETLLNEEKNNESVKVEPFKKKSSSKPSVLLIAGELLAGFRAKRFSHHLDVQKISISMIREVETHLSTMRVRYDCIILHPISDDLRQIGVPRCMQFMQDAVNEARVRAEVVLISLPTPRGENPEIAQKTQEFNSIMHTTYGSVKNVMLCEHTNMCQNGKPIHKYFRDHSTLSPEGLTRISINLKEAVYEALKDDYYIQTKKAQGAL